MAKIKYTPLKISEIDNGNRSGSLYVVNAAHPREGVDQRGSVVFEVSSGTRNVMINVHDTWIPQDLTQEAKREHIIDCPSFRRFVQNGMLHVLSNQEAAAILASPDGEAESRRVFGSDGSRDGEYTLETGAQQAKIRIVKEETTEVSGKIIGIVGRSNSEQIPPSEVLSTLQNLNLSVEDLKYIVQQSTVEQVKNFAARRLD